MGRMRLTACFAILSSSTILASLNAPPCTVTENSECQSNLWKKCIACVSDAGIITKNCVSGIASDHDMCDTITKNLGVVPSSDIQEWVPLDTVTNPAIPPEDPFDNLQDVMDPSLTADLGFLSASNQGLDKSLVNEQGLPAEEDLTDVFTGAPFESAHILNDDFINNLDFDDSDPSEFQDAGIGGCRNSDCGPKKSCQQCIPEGWAQPRIIRCLPIGYCSSAICTCTQLSPDEYFNPLNQGWDEPFRNKNPI